MRREFKRIGEVMKKAITPKYGKEFSASTGLSDGTVDAGGGWMWCVMDSSGQPIKAYNGNKVPVQARLKVKLGYQKGDPRVLRILRVRNVWDEIIPSALGYHGSTHTFPSPDTVWIEQAQYMPLMVQPKSGFVVSIREGVIQWGADVVTVPSQDFDLSADYVTTGARWALIQADNTGGVSRKLGALVDTQGLLTDADIPAPDTDNVALAAIMLYTGQELISRNQYVNDIKDLRTWYSGTGGGGGTGDVTGPASAVDGNLAVFDGTTGKVIKDGGIASSDVITDPEVVVAAFVDYGAELIVNGNFTTDASGWTLGAGWAWESDGAGGGRVRHTSGNTDPLYQDGSLINNAVYKYSALIVGTTGTVDVYADGGDGAAYAATATVDAMLQWASSIPAKIAFYPSSDFDGYIDNVSVTRPPIVPYNPIDGASYVRKNYAWAAFPNADWSAVSGDAQILNKPTLGGAAALNVGTTAGTVAAGDDARLSDARTPTAHATSHKSGGTDAIKLDELAAPTDITTLNASTSAHGLAPKATAPAAGLLSLLGIGNGETSYALKAIFDATNPAALGTAGPGTSLVAARRDHIHTMPTAADLGVRSKLSAARTYYVRTDGSDSNNGLTNTAGGAFLTIQYAIDVICSSIDTGGYTVTIQVADGTYTGSVDVATSWTGGGKIVLQGNMTTPANVYLNTASGILISAPLPATITIQGFKIASSAGYCISMSAPGTVNYGTIEFSTASNAHINLSSPGSFLSCVSDYSISGGATNHWVFSRGAACMLNLRTVTLTGTPAFTTFVNCQMASVLRLASVTFSGSASAGTKKYDVTTNAVVYTSGGVTLPGGVAGTTATGGQYV